VGGGVEGDANRFTRSASTASSISSHFEYILQREETIESRSSTINLASLEETPPGDEEDTEEGIAPDSPAPTLLLLCAPASLFIRAVMATSQHPYGFGESLKAPKAPTEEEDEEDEGLKKMV
jgi:hypothetical protein